jgi:hypothetical protein
MKCEQPFVEQGVGFCNKRKTVMQIKTFSIHAPIPRHDVRRTNGRLDRAASDTAPVVPALPSTLTEAPSAESGQPQPRPFCVRQLVVVIEISLVSRLAFGTKRPRGLLIFGRQIWTSIPIFTGIGGIPLQCCGGSLSEVFVRLRAFRVALSKNLIGLFYFDAMIQSGRGFLGFIL